MLTFLCLYRVRFTPPSSLLFSVGGVSKVRSVFKAVAGQCESARHTHHSTSAWDLEAGYTVVKISQLLAQLPWVCSMHCPVSSETETETSLGPHAFFAAHPSLESVPHGGATGKTGQDAQFRYRVNIF